MRRRAPCDSPLGSPRGVFSTPCFAALRLAAAFAFSLRRVPSLVTAFRSPRTVAPSRSLRPRVNVPDLLLRSPLRVSHGPFDPPAPQPTPVCPTLAASPRAARCRFFLSDPCRYVRFHSPSGLLPPSGSTRRPTPLHAGPPSPLARSPFAPRSLTSIARPPPCCQESRLRITVPGPLPWERLADSQTSWNLIYYAPVCFPRQSHFSSVTDIFLKIYLACFQMVGEIRRCIDCG